MNKTQQGKSVKETWSAPTEPKKIEIEGTGGTYSFECFSFGPPSS